MEYMVVAFDGPESTHELNKLSALNWTVHSFVLIGQSPRDPTMPVFSYLLQRQLEAAPRQPMGMRG